MCVCRAHAFLGVGPSKEICLFAPWQVPLEGFKALQGMNGPQKFNIHKAYSDQERLPSAHTWYGRARLDTPPHTRTRAR